MTRAQEAEENYLIKRELATIKQQSDEAISKLEQAENTVRELQQQQQWVRHLVALHLTFLIHLCFISAGHGLLSGAFFQIYCFFGLLEFRNIWQFISIHPPPIIISLKNYLQPQHANHICSEANHVAFNGACFQVNVLRIPSGIHVPSFSVHSVNRFLLPWWIFLLRF